MPTAPLTLLSLLQLHAWDILAVGVGVLYTHGPLKQLDYKQSFL